MTDTVKLPTITCLKCGKTWNPRKAGERPRACPGCKSPWYDRPRKIPKAS